MEFKFNPPPAKVNGTHNLAATFSAARNAYAELQKPIQLQEFLTTRNLLHYVINFQTYHREFNELSVEYRKQLITKILSTSTACNVRLGPKTAEATISHTQIVLEYSEDLWTAFRTVEIDFRLMQPVANVIEAYLFKTMTKQFNYQVIFYSMGFNPRQLIEEQKALEAAAKEVVNVTK